ncbi:COG3650 family protein [Vibrio coralliilyticus]|uniref:COG3650 family protein n=1 Tax=Vibrio coralliilyticus TaxID=190893 RepID=UPI0039173562
MKALRNPVAVTTLLALQACSGFQSGSEQAHTPQATLNDPSSVKPQTFVMRGEVILGHEVRSIVPCGSQQQYWLDLPEDRFQQGMKLVRSPYAPLYGEVIGHLEPSGKEGFAADYAARFVVDKINLLTAENTQRCAQPAQPTKAFGNEPFWSVQFADNALKFSQMGQEAQQLELTTTKIEADRRRYTFSNGQLELNLRSCSDGMSDSLYGWSSTLTISDKTYRGCATLSNQDTTQRWAATYQAQASKNAPFSVSLAMNPDHTASTTYSYQNGGSDTVEKGFWQQLNPSQVQVVGTHLQGQPLTSERLYTEKDHTLTAKQEKVGSVVYDIAEGGLTLYKAGNAHSSQQTVADSNKVPSSDEFNPQVDQALRDYFKGEKQDPTGTRYRWLTYDLNGDGNKELLAQLDWCGSGGCTLLIFDNVEQKWQFNSRITLVQTPLNLGTKSHQNWRDLVMFVSGGGAVPNQHTLQFNGTHYPLNPSVAPVANYDEISPVQLFSDGLTPHQGGVTL